MGLIPARAGNTSAGNALPAGDYGSSPLARGTQGYSHDRATVKGSSPLARGTPVPVELRAGAVGLIPARAGNTYGDQVGGKSDGAHPRSRGEHESNLYNKALAKGSSPLARGTPQQISSHIGDWGLIPARAGNTTDLFKFKRGDGGSSPLARGTHLLTWDFTPYISKIESLWSQSLTPEYTISSHY